MLLNHLIFAALKKTKVGRNRYTPLWISTLKKAAICRPRLEPDKPTPHLQAVAFGSPLTFCCCCCRPQDTGQVPMHSYTQRRYIHGEVASTIQAAQQTQLLHHYGASVKYYLTFVLTFKRGQAMRDETFHRFSSGVGLIFQEAAKSLLQFAAPPGAQQTTTLYAATFGSPLSSSLSSSSSMSIRRFSMPAHVGWFLPMKFLFRSLNFLLQIFFFISSITFLHVLLQPLQ